MKTEMGKKGKKPAETPLFEADEVNAEKVCCWNLCGAKALTVGVRTGACRETQLARTTPAPRHTHT